MLQKTSFNLAQDGLLNAYEDRGTVRYSLYFVKIRKKINFQIEYMKVIVLILLGILILPNTGKAQNDRVADTGFYAYYTCYGKSDAITGPYADIAIKTGSVGEVVFNRESSYLPFFETKGERYYFDEIVKRNGDGTDKKPDAYNRYSYVRIIENTPDKIVIHWRYYPNFFKTEMTDVVHELFTFTPNGKVVREIKAGTGTIDEWKSRKYTYRYQLQLSSQGIKELSFHESGYKKESVKIEGSPVIDFNKEDLLAYFSLDEGMIDGSDLVKEEITNVQAPVLGHDTYWVKGVSGTALKFDGYYSGVKLPVQYTPQISEEFTIETWINMAAHPFGWVPIVQQSNWGMSGYYLGVNAYGQIGFFCNLNGRWRELVTDDAIYVNKWHQVSVSWNIDSKKLKIYLDGKLSKEKEFDYDGGSLIHGNAPLSIGLNTDKLSALPKERYEHGQFPTIAGWEGAIDELKIFNKTLSDKEIKNSFQNIIENTALTNNIFEKRTLPGNPGIADKFGAEYTELSYHSMWDDAWRTSPYPDILVKFDDLPASVAFWRGTSYGMGWVTEKNYWMVDQSVEWGNARSLIEHMSDKKGRYTHVRLIENTDARVVVHWRYNSCDVLYSLAKIFGDAGLWVDEYITIYPDGTGIRKVVQKADGWTEQPPDKVSWQDVQFLAEAGMGPDDVMNLESVHLANLKGETAKMDWSDGVPDENPLPDANIERINFNSDYKVFLAFQEGTSINPWGGVDEDFYAHFMTWDHWPCAFISSAGKRSLFPTRVSHSALCAADNVVDHGNMAMYGFTNQPVESLVPIVKSWNYPAGITDAVNCKSLGYSKEQRAYLFNSEKSYMKFRVNASESSPLVNPCFVFKNWNGDNKAQVVLNGKEINIGKDNRQGIVRDADGKRMLIVWLRTTLNSEVNFSIK